MILLRLRRGGRGTSRRRTWGCHPYSCGQAGSARAVTSATNTGRGMPLTPRWARYYLALEVQEEERGRHGVRTGEGQQGGAMSSTGAAARGDAERGRGSLHARPGGGSSSCEGRVWLWLHRRRMAMAGECGEKLLPDDLEIWLQRTAWSCLPRIITGAAKPRPNGSASHRGHHVTDPPGVHVKKNSPPEPTSRLLFFHQRVH